MNQPAPNLKQIFAIPIFEDKVDLDIFKIAEEPPEDLQPTWDSGVKTTFNTKLELTQPVWEHLGEIIGRNLGPVGLMGNEPNIGHVWRNRYGEHDYQDPHIHPNSQWSFIVYETVERSRTSFFNPSMGMIQNQLGNCHGAFPLDYKPDLKKGDIIIFPSFLMHSVNSGQVGTTISGNIYMKYLTPDPEGTVRMNKGDQNG
tara:strand:- start:393 stop:992 length:600 start_codon:yes stop_codon:yes gene_type:complete